MGIVWWASCGGHRVVDHRVVALQGVKPRPDLTMVAVTELWRPARPGKTARQRRSTRTNVTTMVPPTWFPDPPTMCTAGQLLQLYLSMRPEGIAGRAGKGGGQSREPIAGSRPPPRRAIAGPPPAGPQQPWRCPASCAPCSALPRRTSQSTSSARRAWPPASVCRYTQPGQSTGVASHTHTLAHSHTHAHNTHTKKRLPATKSTRRSKSRPWWCTSAMVVHSGCGCAALGL